MKKILSVLALLAMVVLLVACSHDDSSSKSSPESMDGTYYEFYHSEKANRWIISKEHGILKVDGDTLKLRKEGFVQYSIDKKEKTITGDDETLSYSYNQKTKVLTVDGTTYVRKDSEKYNKLVDDGARIIE